MGGTVHDLVHEPRLPPRGACPAPGDCHLWVALTGQLPGYLHLLDEAERTRAGRFSSEGARSMFIASRAVQRLVLGHYLERGTGEIAISRFCEHCGRDHGRPHVDGTAIDFSVSHNADLLVIAVVAQGRVGIDAEAITAARAADELAREVLAPAERERFLSLPRAERAAAFVRAWTRKEAVVKLTGHGIVAPLRNLDVSGDIAVASAPPRGWPSGPIYLYDLPPEAGRATALAATVPVRRVLRCGPVPEPRA